MNTTCTRIQLGNEEVQIKHPGTAILMVNDREDCNINCTHCYLPYRGIRDPRSTLDLAQKLTRHFTRVLIAGSEPLLHPEYLEAYQAVGQKYILTNGIALKQRPELYDALRQHGIEELQISLHFGIQGDLHSVPKEIVREVAKQAIGRGFRVQISTTITPQNFMDIESMCDQVKNDIGAQAMKFINYVKSGSAREEERMTLLDTEKQQFFNLVDAVRTKYQKHELDVRIHGNFGPKKGSRGEAMAACNTYCPAGSELFTIDPNNNVYGCPFLMEHHIGRLENDAIILEQDPFNGIRDKCRTCLLTSMPKKQGASVQ